MISRWEDGEVNLEEWKANLPKDLRTQIAKRLQVKKLTRASMPPSMAPQHAPQLVSA